MYGRDLCTGFQLDVFVVAFAPGAKLERSGGVAEPYSAALRGIVHREEFPTGFVRAFHRLGLFSIVRPQVSHFRKIPYMIS